MSSRKKAAFAYAGVTDLGRLRDHNEDAFLIAPFALAVADGLGGHAAGEVAARITVETIERDLKRDTRRDPADALAAAIAEANQAIIERAAASEQLSGMGTTVTAAVLRDSDLTIAHVGDSRAYLLRDGALTQLTEDHSLVWGLVKEGRLTPEEAAAHPQRSVITRALGTAPTVEVDIVRKTLLPGDRILLATDGLTSVVESPLIARGLGENAALGDIGAELVALANARGGPDNITVVLAEYTGSPARHAAKSRVWPRIIAVTLAFLVLAGLALGAIWVLTSHNYYLAPAGGRVAVYRGLPDPVAGIRLARIYKVTGIRVTDLPIQYQERLRAGMAVTGTAEADRVISELDRSRTTTP